MTIKKEILRILQGIDKTEIESGNGWWETSFGADFGTSKLKEIEELLVQPEPEPEAWMLIDKETGARIPKAYKPEKVSEDRWELYPLYASSPKRKPLSDEAICEILLKKEWKGFVELVRQVENFHGIGE